MTGFKSKRAAAQDKLEQWDMPSEAFNAWWDSDYDDSTNPYEKDTFAYWAWAGWQAALAQPAQEPVAWMVTYQDGSREVVYEAPSNLHPDYSDIPTSITPFYTTPPAAQPAQEPVCPECKAGVLYECVACSSNNYPPQGAQKPVAWMYDWLCEGKLITGWIAHSDSEIPQLMGSNIRPLYTAPPQRTWVGLTDEDCKGMSAGDKVVAMWADRTLKEKNNG
jgi:hypothetical protein